MIYKYCVFNVKSKSRALIFAGMHLVSLCILVALLTCFAVFVCQGETSEVGRIKALLYFGAAINVLFIPFSIVLIIGVLKEKPKYIRIWTLATISQICIVFFVSMGGSIIVAMKVDEYLGIMSLIVLTGFLIFFMECIVYINDYYLEKTRDSMNSPLDIVIWTT